MINNIIMNAKKKARKIAETQYTDLCTVTERMKQRNEKTKINEYIENITLKERPCKLTYRNITSSQESSTTNNITQEILLFISPELEIRPGSKIEIEHQGKKELYKNTGKPQIFVTHQEISLEIFEGWA